MEHASLSVRHCHPSRHTPMRSTSTSSSSPGAKPARGNWKIGFSHEFLKAGAIVRQALPPLGTHGAAPPPLVLRLALVLQNARNGVKRLCLMTWSTRRRPSGTVTPRSTLQCAAPPRPALCLARSLSKQQLHLNLEVIISGFAMPIRHCQPSPHTPMRSTSTSSSSPGVKPVVHDRGTKREQASILPH